MHLSFYNTRTRTKELFKALSNSEVSLYCCGPTVYNFAHIGNLRTYIFEDILRRSLEFAGYQVKHVMNITDVGHLSDDGDEGEDKMISAARKQGMTVWDIAAMYTNQFFIDTQKLHIQMPTIVCKATEHIQEMIELIKVLESKGFTYTANGNVHFDISAFEGYGAMALLDRQELKAGARVLVDAAKRNPGDFVLWFTKSKFENQAMLWDSPWGIGYPGWHIECSAMSRKYLGDHFDIHCGGVDHIPVHHTNEIAQTEAATGSSPWVNIWMHGEFLLRNKSKMSKSAGSFATVTALEEQGFTPLDYRFFCLQAHYRTQVNYSDDTMTAAQQGLASLRSRVAKLWQSAGKPLTIAPIPKDHPLLVEFVASVADDLNMPKAMAALNQAIKDDTFSPLERLSAIQVMDLIFALDLISAVAKSSETVEAQNEFSASERSEIEALLAKRSVAKAAKNWGESDAIRNQLLDRGIIIKDGPNGSIYHRA